MRPSDPDRILARQDWNLLRSPLELLGADVESVLPRLRRYAHLLLGWNQGVSNLISRNDEARLVDRHLLESIAPAARLARERPRHIVDFGSGAGLPALPLALAGVGDRWSLVESRRNKTLFLRKSLEDIGLNNIAVFLARLEVAVDEQRDLLQCDVFTSRATATIGPTLDLARQLVNPGGHAFLWKGSSWKADAAESEAQWATEFELVGSEPIGLGPNVVAIFRKK